MRVLSLNEPTALRMQAHRIKLSIAEYIIYYDILWYIYIYIYIAKYEEFVAGPKDSPSGPGSTGNRYRQLCPAQGPAMQAEGQSKYYVT